MDAGLGLVDSNTDVVGVGVGDVVADIVGDIVADGGGDVAVGVVEGQCCDFDCYFEHCPRHQHHHFLVVGALLVDLDLVAVAVAVVVAVVVVGNGYVGCNDVGVDHVVDRDIGGGFVGDIAEEIVVGVGRPVGCCYYNNSNVDCVIVAVGSADLVIDHVADVGTDFGLVDHYRRGNPVVVRDVDNFDDLDNLHSFDIDVLVDNCVCDLYSLGFDLGCGGYYSCACLCCNCECYCC